MLKIIQISKNPKRKMRGNVIYRAYPKYAETKEFDKISDATKYIKDNASQGYIVRSDTGERIKEVSTAPKLNKNPKKKRKTMRVKRKSRIIRAKKNPARRKIEMIIIGLQQLRPRRFKIVYYTGHGFTTLRQGAKKYPGSYAKMEAKRILPMLPPSIIQISTERV
jgi:hypothetical protein